MFKGQVANLAELAHQMGFALTPHADLTLAETVARGLVPKDFYSDSLVRVLEVLGDYWNLTVEEHTRLMEWVDS